MQSVPSLACHKLLNSWTYNYTLSLKFVYYKLCI